jgi:uncharacterized protein (DUF488 family)
MRTLHTIGHSTHTIERFTELLSMHSISAIADVRSSPYSRYNPQFNREPLQNVLRRAGIEYEFLGRELGARTTAAECYVDGKVKFDRLARTDLFRAGLDQLRGGIDSLNICLLCAEKDPIFCHRMILVCRAVRADGVRIRHILEDGGIEENSESEMRLRQEHHIAQSDLFATDEELVEKAYDLQGEKIAYTEKTDE